MRRRMVYRPGFEGSPLRTAVSTSRMRDVPTLGPAPAAQANSFGLIRISDALSRLSILAIARLLDSVNFNSLGRQASTVAVLYGRLNKKAVPLPGERVDQQERPQDWFLRPDLVLLTPSAFLEFSLNRLRFLEMMAKSRQHISGKIRSIHILVSDPSESTFDRPKLVFAAPTAAR